MDTLYGEISHELTECIIPFWKSLRDDRNGGYIGLVDADLTRHPEADKGCILNSRILWFFSAAYRQTGDPALLDEADHAYAMLLKMLDPENGGVFWSVHADGTVADATKHTYNQAFAIYALAEYYRAAGKEKALHLACGLFDVIEQKCRDEDGYLEAFTADWRPAGNEKLSENGVMAYRTMNTLLHLMEGYTGLYQASRDPKVKERLTEIVLLWEKRIYNRKLRRQEVFFDREYHSLIDLHSFGHDIETSWLMDHTLDVLEDEDLIRRIRPLLIEMAENTKEAAFGDHGFANECERGKVDEKRIWWVQAEALVGFLNLWKHTGEKRYLADAQSLWYYISNTIKDKRPGSEWYWFVDADGTPSDKPLVEPWKCPYHNGRMALEAMRRLKGVQII